MRKQTHGKLLGQHHGARRGEATCPTSFSNRSKSKARERADLRACEADPPKMLEQAGNSMRLRLLGGSPGTAGPGERVPDSRATHSVTLDKPLPSSGLSLQFRIMGLLGPSKWWWTGAGGAQRLGRQGEEGQGGGGQASHTCVSQPPSPPPGSPRVWRLLAQSAVCYQPCPLQPWKVSSHRCTGRAGEPVVLRMGASCDHWGLVEGGRRGYCVHTLGLGTALQKLASVRLPSVGAETLDVPSRSCMRRAVTSLQLLSTHVPEPPHPAAPHQLPPLLGAVIHFHFVSEGASQIFEQARWGGLSYFASTREGQEAAAPLRISVRGPLFPHL